VEQYEASDSDTFDYGLAPGESFEPDELGEIDRSQPHIMTVLGPVEPGALGVTNPCATFITGQDDPAAIMREIEEAGYAGINALVNLAPLTTAREADEARWLAGRCELHLIVTTGPTPGMSPDAAAMIREIEVGIGGSGVYPGAIVTPPEPAALRAANEAHLATGLPLIVQAEPGSSSAAVLEHLRSARVDPKGAIVADVRDEPSVLVSAGCVMLFDVDAGGESHGIEDADLVAGVIADGGLDQILLGYDPKPATPLSNGEGSRWSWLIEQFPLNLLEAGFAAVQVRALMVDNPNEALTIQPPVQAGSPEETL
jgi:predicted metal-dependent phosphotriesterase family hydrolase